jgi:2-dehydro-3-deoxyphosphooctonate aldolase (KDO 8-P synthase)
VIAGLCIVEDETTTLRHARRLKELLGPLPVSLVFKASYDKANRSSLDSHRGPGIGKGLEILDRVKAETGLPILTDVHGEEQVGRAAETADILQIPAFLCRQTDLLVAAARSGRIVNIKKGQFLAPWDMKHVIAKVTKSGNEKVTITERGTSFGYNTLVNDFRALPIMRALGYPVIFDATHSVQQPGKGPGGASGGVREMIPTLTLAAMGAGADGLFLETHPDPDHAPSDGPNMIPLTALDDLVARAVDVWAAARGA